MPMSSSPIFGLLVAVLVVALVPPALFPLMAPSTFAALHMTVANYFATIAIVVVASLGACLLIVFAVMVIGDAIDRRDRRALSGHVLSRIEVRDDVLHRYVRHVQYRGLRRPLVGDEEHDWDLDLSEVRYASWFESPLMRGGEIIQLWDRDPIMELNIFGPSPVDPEAKHIGEIPLELFLKSEGSQQALDYFGNKAALGEFDSNVDLATGEYLTGKLPPFAPGFTMNGRALSQRTPILGPGGGVLD